MCDLLAVEPVVQGGAAFLRRAEVVQVVKVVGSHILAHRSERCAARRGLVDPPGLRWVVQTSAFGLDCFTQRVGVQAFAIVKECSDAPAVAARAVVFATDAIANCRPDEVYAPLVLHVFHQGRDVPTCVHTVCGEGDYVHYCACLMTCHH